MKNTKPLQLSIVGASCTGKTTLLESYQTLFPQEFKYVKNTVRNTLSYMRSLSNQTPNNEQTAVYHAVKTDEYIHKNVHTFYDRCILDVFVYTLYRARTSKMHHTLIDSLTEEMNNLNHNFTTIFYIPLSSCNKIPYAYNGVSEESKIRQEIDTLFRNTIIMFNLNVTTITATDLNGRIRQVHNTIQKLKDITHTT